MVQRIKVDIGIDNVLLNNLVRGIGKSIKGAQINIGYTIQDPRPHQLKMLERADITPDDLVISDEVTVIWDIKQA